jgi:hypothetical protein
VRISGLAHSRRWEGRSKDGEGGESIFQGFSEHVRKTAEIQLEERKESLRLAHTIMKNIGSRGSAELRAMSLSLSYMDPPTRAKSCCISWPWPSRGSITHDSPGEGLDHAHKS